MRGAAVLAGFALAFTTGVVHADDGLCARSLAKVDTFGRLPFEARVTSLPAWAREVEGCTRSSICESFSDPEGVRYTLTKDGYVFDKALKTPADGRLPWGLRGADEELDAVAKLGTLLPNWNSRARRHGDGYTLTFEAPGCEAIWIEAEVGPKGVTSVSINAQP